MSSHEVGFCRLREYTARERSRVNEAQFAIGRIYTMMMRLDVDTDENGAAKFPLRISDTNSVLQGVEVEATVLDQDFQKVAELDGYVFSDGYWRPTSAQIEQAKVSTSDALVTEIYLRGYDNDFGEDVEFLHMAESLDHKKTLATS